MFRIITILFSLSTIFCCENATKKEQSLPFENVPVSSSLRQSHKIIDDLPASAVVAYNEDISGKGADLAGVLLDDAPKVSLSNVENSELSGKAKEASSEEISSLLQFFPPPFRRQTRELSADTIQWIINEHTLKLKLITMVRYVDTNNITEGDIINLIKANPGDSNPYSDSHQAHLIALACRDGRTSIVSAILESNPDALNCDNSGFTPLDEAVDFGQAEVAKFLRDKGALAGSRKAMKKSQLSSVVEPDSESDDEDGSKSKVPDLPETQSFPSEH